MKKSESAITMNSTFTWDNWMQACPDCGDLLMPTETSVSDEQDNRVICRDCETVFTITPKKLD